MAFVWNAMAGDAAAATEKMRLSAAARLTLTGTQASGHYEALYFVSNNTTAGDTDEIRLRFFLKTARATPMSLHG